MKTQRGNLSVSAYTRQEFVVILTFNACFINCRWYFSISAMFSEPHTAHPYVNTGLIRQSKRDLEKQLVEMKCAYPKLI